MRKMSPRKLADQFESSVIKVQRLYLAVSDALVRQNQHGYVSVMAEQTLLSASMEWEYFISELFVSYINKDSSQYVRDLEQRGLQSAEAKLGDEVKGKISITLNLGQHLTQEKVRKLVDKQGMNLTFSEANKMREQAIQWLARKEQAGFRSLTDSDLAYIDAWHAMRNYVAHKSPRSREEMNRALQSRHLYNWSRGGANNRWDVGFYLRSKPPGRLKSRLWYYLDKMRSLAKKLVP